VVFGAIPKPGFAIVIIKAELIFSIYFFEIIPYADNLIVGRPPPMADAGRRTLASLIKEF
jgi:hypothetical protein